MGELSSAALSRRTLLLSGAALTAVAIAGCTVDPQEPPAPPPPDPLQAALDEHVALIAQYDAAMAALPQIAPRLAPLRANVAEHVTALAGALAVVVPTPRPTPGPGTESPAAPVPPPTEPEALAALAAGEAQARDRLAGLIPATTSQRAPLVGSIAAAHACHEVLLA